MIRHEKIANERGIGLLHLIVSLGALVAVIYFVMQQTYKGGGRTGADQVPPQSQVAPVTQEVQTRLNEAAQQQQKKMGCAIEEEGCENP